MFVEFYCHYIYYKRKLCTVAKIKTKLDSTKKSLLRIKGFFYFPTNILSYSYVSSLLYYLRMSCLWKMTIFFYPVPKLGKKIKSNAQKCQFESIFSMVTPLQKPVAADLYQLATLMGTICFFKNIRDLLLIYDCYSSLTKSHHKRWNTQWHTI